MLIDRIAEVLLIKGVIPVSQVGSVAVGPARTFHPFRMASIHAHCLPAFNADCISHPAIVDTRINALSAYIADGLMNTTGLGYSKLNN